MSTNHTNNIEQVVAEQHGGPIHIQGTNVVAMSVDVYRDMMGVGTEQELQESLAAIGRGWQAVQQGNSRPFRDALDDLGRKHEAQS
jgi:hypothetical protein